MPELQPFALAGDRGPIHGVVHLPALPRPDSPAVILVHGFKGFMDWGFFPPLADLLAERGLVAVRFTLSGAGVEPGDDLVSDLEAFRTNTFTRELHDVRRVLDAVGSEIAIGRVDRDRIALLGHSRGGGTALLAAATDPWRDRLRALVTWAAVATFDRFSDEEKVRWRETGVHTIVNARTGQELPLGREVLEDAEAHREDYDLLAAAGRRRAPWLLLHGEEDASVPVTEATALQRAAVAPALLQRIAGADHGFGAKHPFQGPTPELIRAMNLTQQWLLRYLRDREALSAPAR